MKKVFLLILGLISLLAFSNIAMAGSNHYRAIPGAACHPNYNYGSSYSYSLGKLKYELTSDLLESTCPLDSGQADSNPQFSEWNAFNTDAYYLYVTRGDGSGTCQVTFKVFSVDITDLDSYDYAEDTRYIYPNTSNILDVYWNEFVDPHNGMLYAYVSANDCAEDEYFTIGGILLYNWIQ